LTRRPKFSAGKIKNGDLHDAGVVDLGRDDF
jgi:hypothetical protein